ncbi:unnamed protein product [Chondrus crispus]|uniref:Uncharacterized protein n=1 Tax=Chondrus crispus TaxID=2769 RepID=R7QEH5_CHOCR|nr:unnamed protein product [Chondrus crispus]CDF36912.1 unnamed protein product [Chondrus crispus]|eukprot:XP_005716731.1 unnamed protein product [Chondrus crispus]
MLDADTAVLEKRLQRDRSSPSSYSASSRSSAGRGVFPPEDKTPALPKAAEVSKPAPLTPKAAEPKTQSFADSTKPAAPSTSAVTLQKPPESSTPPVTSPKPQTQPEPLKKVDVTPPLVLSTVSKALGSNAGIVSSASFDSLSADPTVVLEVSKAFHRLPDAEQRKIADTALKATRPLGYERVSFIEAGTGMEVAHAGIDIDLEDEEENLRAQLAATRKQGDKLASANTNQEAEIDTLKTRLDEERDEFVAKRIELERQIKNMQQENGGLLADLAEAKEEISKMPDRLALEERTVEAEKKSEKLTDTVEMLSKQLTVARDDEARAKQVEQESLQAVKQAEKVKSDALASVAGEIEQAKDNANRKATQDIAEARQDAQTAMEASNKRVSEIENSAAVAQRESGKHLEDTTRSYEQRLQEEQKAKSVEVKSIQDKYEGLLVDMQKKASAELEAFQKEADKRMEASMKEANARLSSMTKERDQAAKETAKVESRLEKDSMKAARERDGLKAKIAKLEAKLKGDTTAQPKTEVEVKEEANVGK